MYIIEKNTKYGHMPHRPAAFPAYPALQHINISGGIYMDEQTRKLLEECCVGCRMAVESFEQIKEYVKDTEFRKLINDYTEKHRQLEDEAVSHLKEAGIEAKSPGIMASAMSWFTTEMKLTFNSDNLQIARLLIDGCTMGIKTLGGKANQYDKADKKAADLAQKIIRTEEDLLKKLKDFL